MVEGKPMSKTLIAGLLGLGGALVMLGGALVMLGGALAQAETKHVVFDAAGAEQKWALKELNPDLPADWSGYKFLVLEVRTTTPQRFELKIHTATGAPQPEHAPVSRPLDPHRPAAGASGPAGTKRRRPGGNVQ